METGSVKLIQDIGKNSGKPYTALKLTVGKWSTIYFPTRFELDYLIEYFAQGNEAQLDINPDESLRISAGEYMHDYQIESKFEHKYVVNYFRSAQQPPTSNQQNDATLDLTKEDEIKENPFGN